MRLQFILSEIGLGLRRNLSMTISVILVTFLSLAMSCRSRTWRPVSTAPPC